MSNERNPSTPSISPWWALLALPIFAALGWFVGQAPAQKAVAPLTPAEQFAAAEANSSQWSTLDQAVEQSQRTGKPIMIDFNADWCPPCQEMKRGVFLNSTNLRKVEAAVIPVSICDRTEEDGANPPEIHDLFVKYEVHSIPTLVVFSPKSGKTERTKGFAGSDNTVHWIESAARHVR